MGDATIASIVILGIVVVSILILIATIFACIFAYKAGKRSGNTTTSIILIVAGCFNWHYFFARNLPSYRYNTS